MPKRLVILGGGPAATHALETIRQFDGESQVTLICDEPMHSRMALPYWLAGKISAEHTHTGTTESLATLGAHAMIGRRATQLDRPTKSLHLDHGDRVPYDQLLLATGSRPHALPVPGSDLPGVFHLWTLKQTQDVLTAAEPIRQRQQTPRVVMIGAGFIGLIVLNAMHKRQWKLAVVERASQVLPRMLNASAAEIAAHWMRSRGVDVRCGAEVQSIESGTECPLNVVLHDDTRLPADIVIVATGVQPNVELAKEAGLEVDHGILVDDQLRTSDPDIFAAGDVAQGPVLHQVTKEVHAIQPTAVDHGRVAGAVMAGQSIRYHGSLSMNVLDVCGLQCASFGVWGDQVVDSTTIANPSGFVYRRYCWTDDRLTGAVFSGRANDMGMLTDVGMVKGLIQTGTPLGPWKQFLRDNPFDIRRPFVATKVAQRLAESTLLGRPTADRHFRHQADPPQHRPSQAHSDYVQNRSSNA